MFIYEHEKIWQQNLSNMPDVFLLYHKTLTAVLGIPNVFLLYYEPLTAVFGYA